MAKRKRSFSMTDDKAQNFTLFAADRTARVLGAMRVLSHCGNRSSYAPTKEQVDKIEAALKAALADTIAALRNGKANGAEPFSL